MAIAKIRNDGKIPYSESIFRYINSINNYENVTLNFTNDRILTLLDVETITNEEVSRGFLVPNRQETFRLLISEVMDPTPTSQETHTHLCKY